MNADLVNKRLSPVKVITVYSNKGGYDYYLEGRDINTVKGKPTLMAPKPLSEDVIRSIASGYIRNNGMKMVHEAIIGSHILHASTSGGEVVIIWYRPAMKKTINFSHTLKIKGDKQVNIPATVFMLKGTGLYIYSLETDQRPGLTTKLFNAPFFNVYEDGRICLGTANIGKNKAETFEKELERFERGFWMAEQNGGDHGGRCKSSLTALWNRLIQSKGAFPVKTELVQCSKVKTLGDLIKKHSNIDFDDEE